MTITKVRGSRRTRSALSNASVTCAAALVAAAGASSAAHASHLAYDIDPLGYRDTLHTMGNGSRVVSIAGINDRGQVVGNQGRYNGGTTSLGQSAWMFSNGSMISLGLLDADYTKQVDPQKGSQSSTVSAINQMGFAAGTSKRYHPDTNADTGTAVWLYDGNTSSRIGFFDGVHSRQVTGSVAAKELQQSEFKGLNDAGAAIGNSDRYNGTSTFGKSAWIHSGTTTTRIGYENSEHTGTDSRQSSSAEFINNRGDVAGTSIRYSGGSTALGQSAWIYNNGSYTPIGITGTGYTAQNGTRSSSVQKLNSAGGAIGTTARYVPGTNTSSGTAAFLVAEGTSHRVGLFNAEHTGTGGTQTSQASQLNDAGYAIGSSNRYQAGGGDGGLSSWVAIGSSTNRTGLVDNNHTGPNGYQNSQALLLSPNGKSAGTSLRYDTSTTGTRDDRGQSAWIHDTGSTRVGLADGQYERRDGYEWSDVAKINDAGHAVGKSQRYEGDTQIGYHAYFYKDGSSKSVGLTDAQHSRPSNSFQFSEAQFLNEAGQAVGYSLRFNQDSSATDIALGRSSWFYDDDTDKTHPLVFSTRQDGFANTVVSFLSDEGLALGLYTLYDGASTVGDRAFLWDFRLTDNPGTGVDERFHDLGTLLGSELSSEQWAFLQNASSISDTGYVLGQGTRTSADGGKTLPFLLTPVPVPEPTGVALIAMTGLALLPRRRRR